MAKTAIQAKLLRDGMGSLSGYGLDAESVANAKALAQIKNVLEDLETAGDMHSRIKDWKDRAEGWQREADAVKN
jgi:hypothetical protein